MAPAQTDRADDVPAECRPWDRTPEQAHPYAPALLADEDVTLRPADAADLYELLKDRETLLLTGSAHSAARADAVVAVTPGQRTARRRSTWPSTPRRPEKPASTTDRTTPTSR